MYNVKKQGSLPEEIITITDYCNMDNNYKPRVDFNLTYNDTGFKAHFKVFESSPRAKYTKNFEEICRDSCVEWFVFFAPDISNRYFNFEVNANGAMDVAFRLSRDEFSYVSDEDVKSFNIVADICNDFWTVDYTISYDFIKKYIPDYEFKKDVIIKSNVYKCGDDTEFEHYGCWGMVDRDNPDFHTPQYFKEMKIV